jgi:REP element-mobilizing transposase RayT
MRLDSFVVMPNHVHGLILLMDATEPGTERPNAVGAEAPNPVGAGLRPALALGESETIEDANTASDQRSYALSEIVRAFKSFSARRINAHRGTPGQPVWQRNYYEHVVRDEESLNRIREYIVGNPAEWATDPENPAVASGVIDRARGFTGEPRRTAEAGWAGLRPAPTKDYEGTMRKPRVED